MRRSTKPFTVEVKKRGGRRRDIGDLSSDRIDPVAPSFSQMVGRDIRFRDAESLFRVKPPVDTGFAEPEAAPLAPAAPGESAPQGADATPRRILPDLIAEAALSEATVAAAPEPRRRGRPPRDPGDEALPRPAKPRRRMQAPEVEEPVFDFEMPEPPPAAPPAVLYLAASARRRAARATDNLPRAERWKRRLPKACW